MIDWTTGRWENPVAAGGPRWRVVIAGDWAPRRHYETVLVDEPTNIYGDLMPVLRDNDLRIVNVETVLGDDGEAIPKNGPNLVGPAAAVKALTTVPWDVATLCNNHTFDFGPVGLAATIQRIQAVGLKTCGAGMSQAEAEQTLHLMVKGVPVALVDCGEGEENRCKDGGPGVSGFDEERLAARVRDLRDQGNVVLVVCHAGREYTPLPPPYIHRWYHRLADAGAHLIVGGHPHAPQGVEIRNGCPIAYSTGNFIFWMETYAKSLQGYVVRAEFAGTTLAAVEIVPYQAELTGLRRLTADEQATLFGELEQVTAPLYDEQKIREHWETYATLRGPSMVAGVRKQLELMQTDPLAGAENARNYFDTPAHRELILTYLRQVMEGRVGETHAWAEELLDLWERKPA